MPIKIPEGIPSGKILRDEQLFVMSSERAYHQDIRPLKILFVNLMPNKQETETQFFRLLGNNALQVEASLLYTASYQPTHTSKRYLGRFYKTFQDVMDQYFDGMIVTGAPVELMPFEKVDYWSELSRIFEWSKTHVFSSIFVCWGAQAGLYHFNKIPKYHLEKKCFGVFPHYKEVGKTNELLRGLDDVFYVPVSRYTEIKTEDVLAHPELDILASSDEAGILAITDEKNKRVFITGHLEYDANTLKKEFERDLANGLDTAMPYNYFPDNNPQLEPLVRWRSTATLIFSNWLNYYVYQQTPYDLEGLGRPNF